MFKPGDVIDNKYRVEGLCSDAGGMGTILFVAPLSGQPDSKLVLKYCKEASDELVKRFRREVRLLTQLQGNKRVVPVIDSNLDHDPPYFVMQYYQDGDSTRLAPQLRGDLALQEKIFCGMIDCIRELHENGIFHRDIKPQNFLLDGSEIVVSDFGLSTEIDSKTAFTKSSLWWGTQGYLPPEFHQQGGFKNPSAASDIFMLGKTFYTLMSGRDPLYLVGDGIPGPLFAIIERCCTVGVDGRYQSLASLKQSLTAAYDVLLGRVVGPGKAGQLLTSITDRLKAQGQYRSQEVKEFVDQLRILESNDKRQMCLEIPHPVFEVLAQDGFQDHLSAVLNAYREMAEQGSYPWSFAEDIAAHMRTLINSPYVRAADKALAVRIAIHAADRQHRYAAMDTRGRSGVAGNG